MALCRQDRVAGILVLSPGSRARVRCCLLAVFPSINPVHQCVEIQTCYFHLVIAIQYRQQRSTMWVVGQWTQEA